jgi:hypothetical protein
MGSNDRNLTRRSDAEKLTDDMEIMELCVDEQAHVAGGALGAIKVESPNWDIALSGSSPSSGASKGQSTTWDIALSATQG